MGLQYFRRSDFKIVDLPLQFGNISIGVSVFCADMPQRPLFLQAQVQSFDVAIELRFLH